jgi:hypothetical protein
MDGGLDQALDQVSDDDQGTEVGEEAMPATVHYHFPISVEVVGRPGDDVVSQVVDEVFAALQRELGSRA